MVGILMSLTSIVRNVFLPRQKELQRYDNEGKQLQQEVLQYLVKRGTDTQYGRSHMFTTIKGYEQFAQHVPLNDYESLKVSIDRMRHGERDVLWPG